MFGCICSFILLFIERMAATGIANYLNTFGKRDDCKCLFQRNAEPLKILGDCKGTLVIMMVPLKLMTASAPLK